MRTKNKTSSFQNSNLWFARFNHVLSRVCTVQDWFNNSNTLVGFCTLIVTKMTSINSKNSPADYCESLCK